MNENKSLKLHKSHKIVCFIVCFVIIFATFAISAFAINLPSGEYTPINSRVIGIDTGNIPLVFNVSGSVLDENNENYKFNYLILYYLSTYDLFTFSAVAEIDDNGPVGEGVTIAGYSGTATIDARSFTITSGNVDSVLYEWLSDNYVFPDNPVYDGNPWVDILNGVLEAVDVNIFGTFSYLDIVSTLAGACLAIWLLKMLAGG